MLKNIVKINPTTIKIQNFPYEVIQIGGNMENPFHGLTFQNTVKYT